MEMALPRGWGAKSREQRRSAPRARPGCIPIRRGPAGAAAVTDGKRGGAPALWQSFRAGYWVLRNMLDIYDAEAVMRRSREFLKAYRSGKAWTLMGSYWAKSWNFYYLALYRQ